MNQKKLSVLRDKRTRENLQRVKDGIDHVEESLDKLLDIIAKNRGHIGGVAVVILSRHDSAIITADDELSDGFSLCGAIDATYDHCIEHHLRKMVHRMSAPDRTIFDMLQED